MESFLPSEIARLVLGYLEDHKCEEAYETFLRTSTHLEECLKMREEGRKFRTEVMGLKLLDILYEYSAIFSLVQERLKRVDPETVNSLKKSGSLLDKITYLLNATISGQTVLFSINFPPGKSPSTSNVAHVRKRLRITNSNDKKRDYFRKHSRTPIDEFSPIVEQDENNAKPSTLETTSLSSLPGNANLCLDRTEQHLEETDIVRTPKRKQLALNSTRRSRSTSEIPEETEENLDITAVKKAFLDNHELQEKLIQNINKVLCTPELAADSNVSQIQDLCSTQNPLLETNTTFPNNFTFELDDAIKKIVDDIESDPVFENFLQDVVCPADETSDDGDDRGISDTSTPCQSTPETVKKLSLKHRLRSSKKLLESPITSSSDINTPTKIDHQNAAAIESIISIQSKPKDPEPSTSGLQGKSNTRKESEPNKEIITELGPTQTINTQALTVETSSAENIIRFEEQKIENRNSIISQPPTPIIITEPQNYQPPIQDNTLVIVSSKLTQSGSQILTVQPGHLQTQRYAEDTLKMPTVIFNNEQNPRNSYVVPHKIFPTLESTTAVDQPQPQPPTQPKVHKNPRILPHPPIPATKPAETITYTFNVQTQPILATNTTNTIPKQVQTINSSDSKPSTSKLVEGTAAGSLPMIPMSSGKKEDKIEQQKTVTPERSDKKVQQLSLSSPRTGRSHIRALDFSTPPKENPTRKSLTSPKVVRSGKVTKTLKASRLNLFKSPVNIPVATQSPRVNLQGDWDGSELIFGANISPRKSRSSENSSLDSTEVIDTNKSVKRLTHVSEDKPLVIDESKNSLLVKIETKEEIPPNPRRKKKGSWDQDLRANIEPIAAPCKKKKTPVKRKKRGKVSEDVVEEQDVMETANKTEEEGLSIEEELAKLENNDSSKENVESQNEIDKKETKEPDNNKPAAVKPAKVTKRKRQTKTKNAPALELFKLGPKVKLEEITDKEEILEDNTQQNKDPAKAVRCIKPRVNKKCNMSNSTKKSTTNKTKTKSESKTEELKTVTVVSPSKMNVNAKKRIFVEQDKPEVKDTQTTMKSSNEPSTSTDVKSDKIIYVEQAKVSETISKPMNEPLSLTGVKSDGQSLETPDMMKPSSSKVITAKRNITPMLETPLKSDSLLCPVTPGLLTPFGTDASFTTLLKQNCGSVDFSSIMTPNFPMTPSFPLTPGLGTGDTHSSYASRPTDYSNSSSYYQPSDSEQSQKTDQVLIEEAMKIEGSKLTKQIWTSTPDKESILLPNRELSIPPNDTMPNSAGDINQSIDTVKETNETIETTKTSVDYSHCKSYSDTSSSSSSGGDQTKENLHIETESNTTVIHITPGTLRRGGKHMALLKQLVKPDDINSDSEKSESPKNLKIDVVPKKINTTKKMEEKPNKLEASIHELKEKSSIKLQEKSIIREEVNKHENQIKKTEDSSVLGRKFNSKVSKVQCPILKQLELKRKRIVAELKKDSTKLNPKPKQERKPRLTKRKIEATTRVTRSKSTTRIKYNNKEDHNKKSDDTQETPTQPAKQKSTSLKRNASIEDVAARLRKDKDNDATEKNKIIHSINQNPKLEDKKMKALLLSPNSSMDSYDSSSVREKYMTPGTTEDEDIPRLHLSSDEETSISSKADPDIVKELKERGIYLVPNKFLDRKPNEFLKDEDNPNIINTQQLQLNVTTTYNTYEQSFDIEDSIPQNKIEKMIEIKSDVYLDESKKIDISKILSQSVVTDTILGKDNKKTAEINSKINSRTKETKKITITDPDVTKNLEITKAEVKEPEKHKEIIKEPETPNEVIMESIKIIEVTTKEIEISKESTEETDTKIEMPKDEPKEIVKENKLVNPQIATVDTAMTEFGDEFDEELFHVKIVNENSPEYIEIVHDESKKITKTIDDYNFAVLQKQISAKVFLEELDIEQDRVLSVTPFIELTTFPAKIPKVILKPLDILYNEICDDSSVDTIIDAPTKTKPKTEKSNKNQIKPQNSSQKSTNKKTKTNNDNDNKEKQKTKSSQQKSDTTKSDNMNSPKVATKKTISLEQYKNKQSKTTKELEEKVIKRIIDESDDTKMEINSEEDSLYTFAVTGNDKTPKKETAVLDSSSKKRKAEVDTTKPTSEKRIKPNDKQTLLKTVKTLDVDQFLSILHGPSNRAS